MAHKHRSYFILGRICLGRHFVGRNLPSLVGHMAKLFWVNRYKANYRYVGGYVLITNIDSELTS